MMTWRHGVVRALGRRWGEAQELEVEITAADAGTGRVRALAYLSLVGEPEVGAPVALNTTALQRGLGTGGYAFVVAPLDRLPADPPPGPGHIVKARYTPQQVMVLGADEQDSPHHDVLQEADDLHGIPVVAADLHSALPAIIAGARAAAQRAGNAPPRVAYLMTDSAALPAAFSRSAAALAEAGWLCGTVTAGQAYGGDLEAVSVHSGLLAARLVLGADLLVAAQGPGNAGTGTRWGFSGVSVGETLNAAAVLGGRPVAALRVSGADERPRHYGLSHHSTTAIGRVALAPVDVAVPELQGALGARVGQQVQDLPARHRVVQVATDWLLPLLAETPVRLSTMGRGLAEDPAPFLAAGAAGVHAAGLVPGHQGGQPA